MILDAQEMISVEVNQDFSKVTRIADKAGKLSFQRRPPQIPFLIDIEANPRLYCLRMN